MRTVVAVQDLLELEIKPDELLEEFARLTERSLGARFVPHSTTAAGCPACGSDDSDAAFEKLGITYRSCRRCATVFASPRPPQDIIDAYYRTSPASVFWRERVVPATEVARSEKIAWPRAQWVADGIAEYAGGARTGADLGPQSGTFARALLEFVPGVERIVLAAATADLDVREVPPRARISPGSLAAIADAGGMDFVVAFDVLDRAADPRALVRGVGRALRPGGLLFAIAPSISGFDLQVLWDRSRTIMPPDRINLFSLRGFRELFGAGWEIRELSTPGVFDAETVRRAMLAAPDAGWPRVLRQMLVESDASALADLQEFLQRHRLSSFARLVLQKRG